MKKYSLLSLLSACLFLAGHSQKTPVEIGFETGLNHNSVYHSDIGNGISKSPQNALGLGASVKINIQKNIGLRASLMYNRFGYTLHSFMFESSTGTGFANGDVLFTSHYLDLPLLAEYAFGKKIRFVIDAGGFFGILLGNRTVLRITQSPLEITETKITSDTRHFNAGIMFGAGIQIPLAPRIKLDLHIRNATGLTSLYSSRAFGDAKTNVFSVLAGLVFTLK